MNQTRLFVYCVSYAFVGVLWLGCGWLCPFCFSHLLLACRRAAGGLYVSYILPSYSCLCFRLIELIVCHVGCLLLVIPKEKPSVAVVVAVVVSPGPEGADRYHIPSYLWYCNLSHLKISGYIYDLAPDCLRCGLLKMKCWEKIPNSRASATLAQYSLTDYVVTATLVILESKEGFSVNIRDCETLHPPSRGRGTSVDCLYSNPDLACMHPLDQRYQFLLVTSKSCLEFLVELLCQHCVCLSVFCVFLVWYWPEA